MKKLLLMMVLISGSGFGQSKEILIGSLSKMDKIVNVQYDQFFTSDLGINIIELDKVWRGYYKTTKLNKVEFKGEGFDVSYTLESNKVISKSIIFHHFPDFNNYLFEFYKKFSPSKTHRDDFEFLSIDMNGKEVEFSTSFFAIGNNNQYENDYLFAVIFNELTKK